MKNRSIQFTKTLLIPLLACVAVFFSASVAQAGEAPFVGTVSGTFPTDLGAPLPGSGGCVFSVPVVNNGRATLLRDFTGTATFIFNACEGTYFGTYTWVSSRGDSIYGLFAGHIEPTDEEGIFDNFEVAVVSGGTGRFANATGYFTLGGQINFITSSFEAPFEGAISRP